MLIQRQNQLESARPELILTGWTRRARQDRHNEVIAFQTIQNVGRGAALHLHLNSFAKTEDNRPTAVMATERLPILAPDQAHEINGEITVSWQNIRADDKNHKRLPISIEILCWDSQGLRHETTYRLFAVELSPSIGVTDEIAPGIALRNRTTVARSVWRLKLSARLRRVPGLRRLNRQ